MVVYNFNCNTWEGEAGGTSSQDYLRGSLSKRIHQAGVQLSGKKHGLSPGFNSQHMKKHKGALSLGKEHVNEACSEPPLGTLLYKFANSAQQQSERIRTLKFKDSLFEIGLPFYITSNNTQPENKTTYNLF